MPTHRRSEAMLWRFMPASEYEVYAMISRDADSWISAREAKCVEEWMQSPKDFHIIRDHCYYSQKIMGGIWGTKNHILMKMKEMCETFSVNNSYDQGFLAQEIYPNIIHTLMVHYPATQCTNKHELSHGYFDDGGMAMPEYVENDEPIPGLSFREVHKLNFFTCCHCEKVHETYIGAILEHIPERALEVVRQHARMHNISLEECPGL